MSRWMQNNEVWSIIIEEDYITLHIWIYYYSLCFTCSLSLYIRCAYTLLIIKKDYYLIIILFTVIHHLFHIDNVSNPKKTKLTRPFLSLISLRLSEVQFGYFDKFNQLHPSRWPSSGNLGMSVRERREKKTGEENKKSKGVKQTPNKTLEGILVW